MICRYDDTTGIFHCDRPGMYFFEIYWARHPGYIMTLHLMKNGITELCRCTGYDTAADWKFPSCAAPVDLVIGDQVWVVSNFDHGQFGAPDCVGFTGFLVTPYF